MDVFEDRRVISCLQPQANSRRKIRLPRGLGHTGNFTRQRQFSELDTGDAELPDKRAGASAHRTTVLNPNCGRIPWHLLQLLGKRKELIIGRSRIDQSGLDFSALRGVFGNKYNALFIALDSRCLRHGGWELSGGGFCFNPTKRHTQKLQQLPAFFISRCGGNNRNIKPHGLLNVLDRNLRENRKI